VSYQQAAGISNAQRELMDQLLASPAQEATKPIQIDASLHVNAPKQLDAIDIYRNQQNQSAMLASAIQEVVSQ
jgi:hypothetical protein